MKALREYYEQIKEANIRGVRGMSIGGRVPNVSVTDYNTPYIRKNVEANREFEQQFKTAETDQEKFDILYKKYQKNKTAVILHIDLTIKDDPTKARKIPFTFQCIADYNPETGDIIFTRFPLTASHVKNITYYKTNTKFFKFIKREHKHVGDTFVYTFICDDIITDIKQEPNPNFKPGNPAGRKKVQQ